MAKPKLLGISGSLRKASTNTKLLREAARLFGECDFTEADLHFPLYDGDLEDAQGIPPEVQTLADQIAAADAVIISGPEYNKGITGVLKNALDWVSRTKGNPWSDKPVAITSATAGRAGGERTQVMLRMCLYPFRPRLLQGPEVLVAASADAFDDDGRLRGEMNVKTLTDLMAALKAEMAR
ncbi:NAD(P)H-dependent oxidoreductase [Lutimaribacter sp. EGI FJ00015]|uniref:NAD(P)H-dependent oxidoreductase n=1 Tax=Lutimaribacter degradans TaxID=2945989 RepID=A0ACC5ZXV5_9RHOB|nr:NADPH-dependent FMN reductase [Lutimaribacter sp. EGI FJ00013]MCM2562596.1 NAD(P)H-dependent oxidoreductase [Lutimaribacter sp. EGI FJ00013]MCO0613753.1 NAD(P)H-dependent oxidoreductase [Lutimaribacter sp. EGI FJ00015]MCO0636764.1 NAD(P)H-dependent oxidoreductase [Lutimaribacter sp. EGI FJ00014]